MLVSRIPLSAAWLFLFLCAANVEAGQTDPPGAKPEPAIDLAVVLDLSNSMNENNRLVEAKQAAQLACLVLNGRLKIIGFSDEVTASPVFDLGTERRAAIAWLAKLQARGGTHYLKALESVVSLQPRQVLFLSDGEPEETPESILKLIQEKIRCPLHTIAVQTSAEAHQTLSKMAAATGGGFHRVDEPTRLIDTFLAILGQVSRYRRCEMTDNQMELSQVQGELLAIGFEGDIPEIVPAGPEPFAFALPGYKLNVLRSSPGKETVTVRTRGTKRGRVVVLRFDQPLSQLRVGSPVVRGERVSVPVETEFRDPQGKPLPPDALAALRAFFEAVDPDGKVIQQVEGKPTGRGSVFGATLNLPARKEGPTSCSIRNRTSVTMAGHSFEASETRAVLVDPLSAPARSLDANALQLLVVSQRSVTGRRVIFDSLQQRASGAASARTLEGDLLALELVRGEGIAPKEFVSLGQGLRARFLDQDGASREVQLSFQKDHYATAPVQIKAPGKLLVQVDISTQGLQFRLEAEVLIEKVSLGLIVAQHPLRTVGRLPAGAVVPLEVSVAGKIGTQSAGREDLLEVCQRQGLRVRQSLQDGGGNLLSKDEWTPDSQPFKGRIHFQRPGEQICSLDLVDHRGEVLDSLRWRVEVVDSPIRYGVFGKDVSGRLEPKPSNENWWGWLPEWLLEAQPRFIVATPAQSPILAERYLASVRVGGVDAEFTPGEGRFCLPVSEAGTLECQAALKPYAWAAAQAEQLPEILVSDQLSIPRDVKPRWGRLALALGSALLLLGTVGRLSFAGARRWYRHQLQLPRYQLHLFGSTFSVKPLLPPAETGWWPRPELLICQAGPHPDDLVLVYPPVAPSTSVLARVRQHLDGSVVLVALRPLPDLGEGSSRLLSEPGAGQVRLTDTTTLALVSDPT